MMGDNHSPGYLGSLMDFSKVATGHRLRIMRPVAAMGHGKLPPLLTLPIGLG
jgi:hypothetical protein